MNTFLDEQLELIYLQEDLRSFTKDKIEKLVKLIIKHPNEDTLLKVSNIVPDVTLKNIETYISKSSELKKNIDIEARKPSTLPTDLKRAYDITAGSLKTLKLSMSSSEKVGLADRLLTGLHYLYADIGKSLSTAGVIVKVITFLAKYLWELHMQIPELRIIFNLAAVAEPYALGAIIYGVICLLLAFLFKLWRDKRREAKKYIPKSSNSYEEYI